MFNLNNNNMFLACGLMWTGMANQNRILEQQALQNYQQTMRLQEELDRAEMEYQRLVAEKKAKETF